MESKLSKKQIEAAVEWWSNALKSPKFQTLRPGDNNLGSQPARMAEIMATVGHKDPQEDGVTKFKDALRAVLNKGEIRLNVDYHPCRELSDCLAKAGIDPGITLLPWKTSMHFDDGGVQVACGYGEPYIELLAQ